jgi:hypothetical protein
MRAVFGKAAGRAKGLMAAGLLAAVAGCGGGGGGDDAAMTPMPADTQAPTLRWTAPANLATGLAGSVALQVDARDDSAVAAVEYEVDGEPLAEVAAAPFGSALDTTRWASGQHVLRARARDAGGRRSDWQALTVRFDNAGRTLPAGFTRDASWTPGLSAATAFAPLPDGRWLVAEQGGTLRLVAADGTLRPQRFHAVTVDARGERGLIGVACTRAFRPCPGSTCTTPPPRAAPTAASAASWRRATAPTAPRRCWSSCRCCPRPPTTTAARCISARTASSMPPSATTPTMRCRRT